jgi:hypothetical protein
MLDFHFHEELSESEELLDQFGIKNPEILTRNHCNKRITWFSEGGLRVIRKFQFETVPLQAVFCTFLDGFNKADNRFEVDAIAVLVTSFELHLFFLNGESYEIKLPFQMRCIVNTSFGLVFERTSSNHYDVLYYCLLNPFSTIKQIDTDFQ